MRVVSVSLACFAVLCSTNTVFAAPLRVVNYNVENLFHPAHDSLKDDLEWTPEGDKRWSYTRYYRKVENIARVLTVIGEWDGADVVGLQEVENAECVKRLCYTLRRGEYDFVHYESPDRRGIDVAFIYKKARIDTLSSKAIRVNGERTNGERTNGESLVTRDILYVCTQVDKKDTIHFFVCHLPSQRGGKAESEWKRLAAKQVLQEVIDSVLTANKDAKIVVMGDMNDDELEISGLTDKKMKGEGTHKYQGRWTFLDHFYVSPATDSISEAHVFDAKWIQEPDEKYMGLKPKRTYSGFQYKNGFSDHLPIVMDLH